MSEKNIPFFKRLNRYLQYLFWLISVDIYQNFLENQFNKASSEPKGLMILILTAAQTTQQFNTRH